jgi:hypothetical protein
VGGVSITPSLTFSNFQIYTNDDSIVQRSTQSLCINLSSILFNEGELTITHQTNTLLTGLIGINTQVPAYALDIGLGDARKPSGTTWITVSDERVKENIVTVDYKYACEQIGNLRLVSHTWKQPYRGTHSLSDHPILGFLSQEVERVFPNSVEKHCENGFPDFRTLDTDQLYKAKFAVTQAILYRISSLQSRILVLKESDTRLVWHPSKKH